MKKTSLIALGLLATFLSGAKAHEARQILDATGVKGGLVVVIGCDSPALLAELQPIADEHKITPAQLAIAWTIAQPGVTHALCGARSAEQALENAHAADEALNPEEVQRMNEMIEQHIWQR